MMMVQLSYYQYHFIAFLNRQQMPCWSITVAGSCTAVSDTLRPAKERRQRLQEDRTEPKAG